ncbi:hypothetical protein AAY473_026002 [Plecturocebus cupreus]
MLSALICQCQRLRWKHLLLNFFQYNPANEGNLQSSSLERKEKLSATLRVLVLQNVWLQESGLHHYLPQQGFKVALAVLSLCDFPRISLCDFPDGLRSREKSKIQGNLEGKCDHTAAAGGACGEDDSSPSLRLQ